jgi:hypothetical protein
MPPRKISAVDSVKAAIELIKKLLFTPFRFGHWWRMGLLAMACGEMFSGCSSNINLPGELAKRQPRTFSFEGGPSPLPNFSSIDWNVIAPLLTIVLAGGVVLAFVHMYVSSVLRFVMYDAVLTGDFRLLYGWNKWHRQGVRLFWFKFLVSLAFLTLLAGLIGAPLMSAANLMRSNNQEDALKAALALLAFIPVLLILGVIAQFLSLLLKDFGALIMMFEDVSAWEALKRVLGMANRELNEFAAYVGLKIALSIGEGIVMGTLESIVWLLITLPAFVTAWFSGMSWEAFLENPFHILMLITTIFIAMFVVNFAMAVLGSPITAGFIGYVTIFFGSRYEPLWQVIGPQMPAPLVAPYGNVATMSSWLPPPPPPPLP